jgi:hypothetical protein
MIHRESTVTNISPGVPKKAGYGIYGGRKVALGQVFLRVLQFPLPILIPPTIGQIMADVPCELSLNPNPRN